VSDPYACRWCGACAGVPSLTRDHEDVCVAQPFRPTSFMTMPAEEDDDE